MLFLGKTHKKLPGDFPPQYIEAMSCAQTPKCDGQTEEQKTSDFFVPRWLTKSQPHQSRHMIEEVHTIFAPQQHVCIQCIISLLGSAENF